METSKIDSIVDLLYNRTSPPQSTEFDISSIFELIEEISKDKDTLKTLLESQQKHSLTIQAIPEIPVSEIGWSDVTVGEEDEGFHETARGQLHNFLKNIQGRDLKQKLDSLANFYKGDEQSFRMLGLGSASSNADKIAKVMSYLVFYKTLTTIIGHFNASSAGFSFESFLAVLLGGTQVPTGEGTIADLKTKDGTPISLKLYNHGSVKVGGSWVDLVNDLISGKPMQYVVVTKTLSGEGLERSGALRFYRFNFTLDNVYNIIANSSKESRRCLILPKAFLSGRKDVASKLPAAGKFPSPQELEKEFMNNLASIIKARGLQDTYGEIDFEALVDAINYANSEDIWSKGEVVRGRSAIAATPLDAKIRELEFLQEPKTTSRTRKPIRDAIIDANDAIRKKYSATEAALKRSAAIKRAYFEGAEGQDLIALSQEAYNKLSAAQKKRALKQSFGYTSVLQFEMTRTMVERIATAAAGPEGTQGVKGLFPEGQTEVFLTQLEIGPAAIQEMLNRVVAVINESIFEIFGNLKDLTTSIQAYFATALKNDDHAKKSITSAKNIQAKTKEVSGVE
jgi:hypothetical protein